MRSTWRSRACMIRRRGCTALRVSPAPAVSARLASIGDGRGVARRGRAHPPSLGRSGHFAGGGPLLRAAADFASALASRAFLFSFSIAHYFDISEATCARRAGVTDTPVPSSSSPM